MPYFCRNNRSIWQGPRLWFTLAILGTISLQMSLIVRSLVNYREDLVLVGKNSSTADLIEGDRNRSSYSWLGGSGIPSGILSELHQHHQHHLKNQQSMTEFVLFILLSFQSGAHPILVKLYMPPNVVRTSVILSQESIKLTISLIMLTIRGSLGNVVESWTLHGAILAAGIPASLFVIQSYCNLMANQTLPPVTFVLLSQTKIIATAWCCFLLLGQKQSKLQIMALSLLVISTLLLQRIIPIRQRFSRCLNIEDTTVNLQTEPTIRNSFPIDSNSTNSTTRLFPSSEIATQSSFVDQHKNVEDNEDTASRLFLMGIVPVLIASFLSGLAGTITQKALQMNHRDPFLFNMELSIFSTMLLSATHFLVGQKQRQPQCAASTAKADTDADHRRQGNTQRFGQSGWTLQTWIPIVSHAIGAILVGLVTKYSGAVTKGFAIIFGIMVSAMLNQMVLTEGNGRGGMSLEELSGGFLGIASLWIHVSNPPTK
ncbi:nucleotide-sugar transporter [Nitzschia inconspicua]|uniref:Nucleotide-sugar transporter n=1 Tax=Nitzschia inconspicua TaxID=303405 RepID=A0A9K3LIL9_9STRA|nr:nucleotide-sugar transporter [Nitzschia inconspicua]